MTTTRRGPAPATVPAPLAGAGRVVQQGGVLYALVELASAFGWCHFDGRQYAAVMLVGTPVVGFVQELVENRFGRAWLRSLPDAPAQVPVVAEDDAGHALTCVLVVVSVLVLLAALLLPPIDASPPAREFCANPAVRASGLR